MCAIARVCRRPPKHNSRIGKRVYFDVNVFIYAVEPSETMQAYFATVSRLFELAVIGQITAMTSELKS
jgi:hypothetical protein